MSRMDDILSSLVTRTDEGKLKWKPSVDSETFLTSVDTIGIVVKHMGRNSLLKDERHRLEILNDQGIKVEILETQDDLGSVPTEELATTEQARDLSRLYTLARRSALESDMTLEKLARNLERL